MTYILAICEFIQSVGSFGVNDASIYKKKLLNLYENCEVHQEVCEASTSAVDRRAGCSSTPKPKGPFTVSWPR